jgi:hypothetical protein
MLAHTDEIRLEVLEKLKHRRSLKEISGAVGIPVGTIEDWAADWRKSGDLTTYNRSGMEYMNRAKLAANGYYACIRIRYAGMKWTDKLESREFGFDNQLQAIIFYLDDNGNPRPCAYCGAIPPDGKVWGLDRIDSSIGHAPGNVVPCCSFNSESTKLSCQLSKSKFTLREWMRSNLSRAFGRQPSDEELKVRLSKVHLLAKELQEKLQNT